MLVYVAFSISLLMSFNLHAPCFRFSKYDSASIQELYPPLISPTLNIEPNFEFRTVSIKREKESQTWGLSITGPSGADATVCMYVCMFACVHVRMCIYVCCGAVAYNR